MTPASPIMIIGGARSGKSRYAEELILHSGMNPVYLASAQAGDAEMAQRIAEHRRRRGSDWRTLEAPLALPAALRAEMAPDRAILVDCLTLWLSNLMLTGHDREAETGALLAALSSAKGLIVLVSNEVGLGIVPDNALARAFRDEAGRLNQSVAAAVPSVAFMAAGLPLWLKGGGGP